MSAGRSNRLVVKLTTGATDPEKVTVALSVAAAGVAGGLDVALWLSGDAVEFARPGGLDGLIVAHAPAAADSFAAVLELGRVTACAPCLARRGIEPSTLVDAVAVAGAAAFVEDATAESTTALVY